MEHLLIKPETGAMGSMVDKTTTSTGRVARHTKTPWIEEWFLPQSQTHQAKVSGS